MSRRHNTRHNRSRSHYPERLAERGESSATVRMPFFGRDGRQYDTIDTAVKRNKEGGHDD